MQHLPRFFRPTHAEVATRSRSRQLVLFEQLATFPKQLPHFLPELPFLTSVKAMLQGVLVACGRP